MTDIRKEIVIEAGIEEVWQALSTSEGLAEWLMPNDFKPEVGAKFRFEADEDCTSLGFVECTVTEIDPPRRIAFTWNAWDELPDTLVAFDLRDLGGKTALTLTHSGFEALPAHLGGERDGYDSGWNEKLADLKAYLGG